MKTRLALFSLLLTLAAVPAFAAGVDQIIMGADAVADAYDLPTVPIPNEWEMYGGGKGGGGNSGGDAGGHGSLPPGDDGYGDPPANDAPVPEPATIFLLGAGAAALALKLRHRA